jgi:hypothetical protein
VLPPVIHLILGITKKLWDLLFEEVQLVESKVVAEQKLLQEAYTNISEFVSSCEAVAESNEEDHYATELQISECKTKREGALKRQFHGDNSLELKLELYEVNEEFADFKEELASLKTRQCDLNLKNLKKILICKRF